MRTFAAAVLLLSAVAFPAAAEPAPVTQQVVVADGHVDLGPRFVDGRWTVQLRDDTADPAVWRPLENVVLQVSGKAQVAVPADPAFAFLGKPGQRIWVIPQVQRDGVLWPGWNTQETEVAKQVDREVTWSLEGVEGPGAFTLFLNSDFGKPETVFDSRTPLPQQTGIDVNTHVHGNWTFEAPGTYLLRIAMTAKLTDGSTVTDRRTLRLYAGDGDARAAFSVQPKSAVSPASPAAAEQPAGEDSGSTRWIVGGGVLVLIGIGLGVAYRRTRKVSA
ncbi:hypothetical protein Kfla_2011 [Kribbella flavida DSM 17836]|uniref:ABC transporter-associated repeat protein n=1 Tax=Kribbella flavida (strain DSM 17836 / JCM 10339 / NBRC 14399) TaxID=479435 RepID=D2PQW9_KRIFD|nr:TIGR03773 family transporter-associated surface protein [Kribbella flavida]ADB31102.1 hypothetical protein Kfla_2011 [Kribbella flavida DSM 17836]